MEDRPSSVDYVQQRSSLRALVQGLGIQLPAEPPTTKHKKSVSSISIVVRQRPASPSSPKRVSARPVTAVARAISPRAISPRVLSPRVLSPRALSPRRAASPRDAMRFGSPRNSSPRATTPRKSLPGAVSKKTLATRTGSPRPGSPTVFRSPRAVSPRMERQGSPRVLSPRPLSPRPNSPRQSSPRARSPFSRTYASIRASSPKTSRPPPSPRCALKSDSGTKKVTKPKPSTAAPAKIAKKVSFAGIALGKTQPAAVKKDETPQPPPLSAQAIRELEASKAMVSPRIEFDASRTPSPPPHIAEIKPLKPILRPVKNRDILTSLVTKIENTVEPGETGRSKAEIITRKHLYQTFRGLKMARGLPIADMLQIQAKRVVLMKPPGKFRRKTAIFDLDETLVHCLDPNETTTPDVVLPIRFPNGDIVHARMKIRPYCTECLTQVSEDMELIVFTASQRSYADAVMNYIDPTRMLIHHRLYRENCVVTDRIHIKDLRILANRSLKDMVIIDNAAYSFGYQIDNGIPIISWHDDPHDKELLYLTQYLRSLLHVEDVREVNQATFHLSTFYSDYSEEFLGKDKSRLK